jgi:hypothetical protein
MSFDVQGDRQAVAIRPVVHPLLASFQATAYRPDGTQEVLIWARGYQGDWDPTYYFKRPVPTPAGTRLEVILYFDNSDNNPRNPNNPAKPVQSSELTKDYWGMIIFAVPVE